MYRARYIVAGSLVAIVAAFLVGIALLPAYLVAREVETSMGASQSTQSVGGKDDRAEAGRAQLIIGALAPVFAATTSPSEVIGAALSLRPPGVFVDRILYSSGSTKEVVLGGHSVTREAISAYQVALKSDSHFKTAAIPISDLAGTKEGRFSVTLTGAF